MHTTIKSNNFFVQSTITFPFPDRLHAYYTRITTAKQAPHQMYPIEFYHYYDCFPRTYYIIRCAFKVPTSNCTDCASAWVCAGLLSAKRQTHVPDSNSYPRREDLASLRSSTPFPRQKNSPPTDGKGTRARAARRIQCQRTDSPKAAPSN